MTPIITVSDVDSTAFRGVLETALIRFNEHRTGHPADGRPLVVVLRHFEAGDIIGGLLGWTGYTQLHVELLFVPEALRGQGIGQETMRRAEGEAARRGCRGAWLDTYSFQARGFYERLGYVVFGTIEDYLPGHSRFFLKKALVPMPLARGS